MQKTIAISVLLALGACSPMVWDKEGGTQAAFNRDNYRCQQEAQTGLIGINHGYGIRTVRPTADRGMYQLCMQAAGYTQRPN